MVRLWAACRGPRAWHVKKEQTGTWEALRAPAALTARAKREGEIGNFESLQEFYWASCKLLFKWLNRRSQKPSYTWRAFNRLL
jgi:hypothetical protein